jgi:uncharacterized membrane protein YecN with MAPEG domain
LNVAYICVALLGILVLGGGFYVSLWRNRTKIVQGYPDDPSHGLHKAVRAHGNTVEYAPVLALIIYIAGLHNPPLWILVCMVGVTIARYLLYFGLLLSPTIARPQPLRFIGALLTYILGIVLCSHVLLLAVS